VVVIAARAKAMSLGCNRAVEFVHCRQLHSPGFSLVTAFSSEPQMSDGDARVPRGMCTFVTGRF
jgi:hypothetical protein